MRRRSVLVTLLALGLGACSGGGLRSSGGPASDHPLLGAKAPGFELPAQAGGSRVSLDGLAGKVVIVDFWATWCEPCKDSFPYYQGLIDRHGGQVAVVGVSVDDEPDGIAAFGAETGVKFPLAWDDGQSLSRQYQPSTMPTSYILDRNGIVRFVHVGFRSGDEAEIDAHVQSLLK